MPKRTDIEKILIIGSGPIIIGQACEFDYSGTQACKALREEGYKIILVNSNPATIMTDPEIADRTYIEPITPEVVEQIIEKEQPDALLPTLGGQTGLNVSVAVAESGVLDRYGVELIGAQLPAIKKAEDREYFKASMQRINLEVPKSALAYSMADALAAIEQIGLPVIIRPAYTLGGTGGGVANTKEELIEMAERGLRLSPIQEILIEESVIGWKEFELEVMRDKADNVVIICSIENFDPMGVHTGDSITVAPAQTLSDKEYQLMRDSAIKIIREIGVDTGGSNIQFAVNPETGKQVVIEMNPRVSRSSALASKATGFPIAKIAAKLAVGYTLDEIKNDITRQTPASFEPTIDYVVVKIPRWAFEKFEGADQTLTTQMKSVGEAMSIGRTFKEAFQKGLRSLETGWCGLDNHLRGKGARGQRGKRARGQEGKEARGQEGKGARGQEGKRANHFSHFSLSLFEFSLSPEDLIQKLTVPNVERVFYIKHAMRNGMNIDELYEHTKIDPFFLYNIKEIVDMEERLRNSDKGQEGKGARGQGGKRARGQEGKGVTNQRELLCEAKRYGFSDKQIAELWKMTEEDVRKLRKSFGIEATFKTVDTCAAEFEAETPYYYSTYEWEDEVRESKRKKIMILGGGPNRIGQGIEFDYCCVHAVLGLKEDGYETIMVNSNPETVSTDYDIADRLYFEPLTLENVLDIIDKEKPDGVIVQFGGQTPLNLAVPLKEAGVNIIGTSPDDIDRAEDRKRFREVLFKVKLQQPQSDTATSIEDAKKIAQQLEYPVMVRPSYVLGGRAMEIVYDEEDLQKYTSLIFALQRFAVDASEEHPRKNRDFQPVLVDKYLDAAIEIDVDAISDGKHVVVGGVMEHIEEAGIHSGDSACVLPAYSLSDEQLNELRQYTYALAKELNVVGLMNIQYAIKGDDIYVLEVNPRASRTVPFVSKAIGVPLAKLAARVMAGKTLAELGFTKEVEPDYFSVKKPVFPFDRFPGADPLLGPEMRSTGEVMGIDEEFGVSFAKAQAATGQSLPTKGKVFISVRDRDKRSIIFIARTLYSMGFELITTHGTYKILKRYGMDGTLVYRIGQGYPTIHDYVKKHSVDLIINTPTGREHQANERLIRQMAIAYNIPLITTISGAAAAVNGIDAMRNRQITVKSLQEYYL